MPTPPSGVSATPTPERPIVPTPPPAGWGPGTWGGTAGRSAWLRRRAGNVRRRRPLLIWAAVSGFVLIAGVLLAAPIREGLRRRDAADAPRSAADTVALLATLQVRDQALTQADARLESARRDALRMQSEPAAGDTISPASLARRDSLAAVAAELARLMKRAGDAPLPASYRALAQAPALRDVPRVRPLLDSLDEIEQNRSTFGAIGGVDPIFVALTTRAGEIGKAIEQLAVERRAALRHEVEQLDAARRSAGSGRPITVDTLALSVARGNAARELAAATIALDDARRRNGAVADEAVRVRMVAAVGGSPLAALGAAATLGLAAAFALAIMLEMRRPRVADALEAEAASGARVVLEIRSAFGRPDGLRRKSDREVPPAIDLLTDTFDHLYGRLADGTRNLHRVTVCSEESRVAVVVAANLATAAVHRARSALLVDADIGAGAVSSLLRVPREPGLSELMSGSVEWPSAIAQVLVARDRTIDVITAGEGPQPADADVVDGATGPLGATVEQVARRYDTVVLCLGRRVEQLHGIEPRSIGSVLMVVRTARSELSEVSRLADAIRSAGCKIAGVVLWELPDPDAQGGGREAALPASI